MGNSHPGLFANSLYDEVGPLAGDEPQLDRIHLHLNPIRSRESRGTAPLPAGLRHHIGVRGMLSIAGMTSRGGVDRPPVAYLLKSERYEFEAAESPVPYSADRVQYRDSGGLGSAFAFAAARRAVTGHLAADSQSMPLPANSSADNLGFQG